MLLDQAGIVIVDVTAGDEPALAVVAHLLLVNVEARTCLPHQHAGLLHGLEILASPRVDDITVGVGLDRQIDLRAVDMQQAVRPAGCQGRGFRGVDDIIRHAGHFGRAIGGRNKTLKGMEAHGRERPEIVRTPTSKTRKKRKAPRHNGADRGRAGL